MCERKMQAMQKHCWSQVLQSEDENYLVTYSQFEETKKPYEHKNKKVNLIHNKNNNPKRFILFLA